MQKLLFLIVFLAPLISHSQQTSIVSGKITNIHYSKIALHSFGCPLTGAMDNFTGELKDSGNFVIQAQLYAPEYFNLEIDDYPVLLYCTSTSGQAGAVHAFPISLK